MEQKKNRRCGPFDSDNQIIITMSPENARLLRIVQTAASRLTNEILSNVPKITSNPPKKQRTALIAFPAEEVQDPQKAGKDLEEFCRGTIASTSKTSMSEKPFSKQGFLNEMRAGAMREVREMRERIRLHLSQNDAKKLPSTGSNANAPSEKSPRFLP